MLCLLSYILSRLGYILVAILPFLLRIRRLRLIQLFYFDFEA